MENSTEYPFDKEDNDVVFTEREVDEDVDYPYQTDDNSYGDEVIDGDS